MTWKEFFYPIIEMIKYAGIMSVSISVFGWWGLKILQWFTQENKD